MNKTIRTVLLLVLSLFAVPAGLALAAPQHAPDAQAARADIQKALGFLPRFFDAMADSVLPGAWEEMKGLQLNPNSALPGRTKELIGLAVAAQVPCRYCTYAHIEFAKLNGASEVQLTEAVALAGLERHWSAYLAAKEKALISLAVASQVPSKPCIVAETELAKLAGATEREIDEAVGMAAITRNMSTMLNGQLTDETAFRADIDHLVQNVKAAQKQAAAATAKR